MAWYRCEKKKEEAVSIGTPIFENGAFKNSDVFTAAYAANPAAGDITIVDNELLYPAYNLPSGGLRITNNNGDSFLLLVEFEAYDAAYIQFGRCSSDADPYNCIAAGWGRIVYTYIEGVSGGYYPSAVGIKSQYEGVFLSGNGFKIKSIYALVGDNYVIPSNSYY